MKNLAYVTLLIEANNEDDFDFDTTWNELNDLLEPSYIIRGTISKTPIHYDEDICQREKVRLTQNAYQEHISELSKYDF